MLRATPLLSFTPLARLPDEMPICPIPRFLLSRR
jgi:hypothetical protein